ncbi:MAG: hypothetical protein OXR62_08980 [Ahrensia sp.]|nr:hypothetical protein [Ahrensia sp.]
MTFLLFAKILASLITGMLAIPFGILPSILLFRDLANGVDTSERAKRTYAVTLWGGMIVSWALGSWIAWLILGAVFS